MPCWNKSSSSGGGECPGRKARLHRAIAETDIRLDLTIAGRGRYQVQTGIRFLDHMLELFARHGAFDLKLQAKGDLDVDQHHTVEDVGIAHLTFSVDSRGGGVAIHGWKEGGGVEPRAMMQAFEPYCSAFLYTHIDTEGTLCDFPMEIARNLRSATSRRLIVAGGIRSLEEVEALETISADAVVGMAMYVGAIGK